MTYTVFHHFIILAVIIIIDLLLLVNSLKTSVNIVFNLTSNTARFECNRKDDVS